jgi:hypothetical protein
MSMETGPVPGATRRIQRPHKGSACSAVLLLFFLFSGPTAAADPQRGLVGEVWIMMLEMPPADVSEAVFPVRVKECTRDRAASNR